MKLLGFRFALSVLVLCSSCSRTGPDQQEITTPELKVSLSSDYRDGKVAIRVNFEVAPGWHIYGPQPQKNGRPTSLEVLADEKVVGSVKWPNTKVFDEGESGPSDGYEGSFEVKAECEEIARFAGLKAKVTWVACKEICVPGVAELMIRNGN